MPALNAAKIVRRVRHRLQVSQEGLSRLLNATKGAVQHWERGRNNPDLARLLALRELCPPGAERRELEALARHTQGQVAPVPMGKEGLVALAGAAGRRAARLLPDYPGEGLAVLRRQNTRLQREAQRLRGTLQRQKEELRILKELAADLQRELSELRAGQSGRSHPPHGPAPSA